MNGPTSTVISCSPKSRPDITWLMSRMEELGVPPSYTWDLDEIYFTRLAGRNHGDYCNNKIRLSVDKESWSMVDRTLVHELAHHIDDQEDITGDDALIKERKLKGRHMADSYARKNVGEYLAVGFEVYYVGTRKERGVMRAKNPVLYHTISRIHKRYRKL